MTWSSSFTSTVSSSSFPLDSNPPLGQRQRRRRSVLYFCLCLVANCPSRLFNSAEASSASATTPAIILHPGCTNSSFALPPPLLLLQRRLVVGGSDETSSPLLPLRRQLLAALLPLRRPRNSTLWLLLPPLMLLIASTFFLIFSHSPECTTFKHSYIRGRSAAATTLTACRTVRLFQSPKELYTTDLLHFAVAAACSIYLGIHFRRRTLHPELSLYKTKTWIAAHNFPLKYSRSRLRGRDVV